MPHCQSCGHSNPDHLDYCQKCQQPMRDDVPPLDKPEVQNFWTLHKKSLQIVGIGLAAAVAVHMTGIISSGLHGMLMYIFWWWGALCHEIGHVLVNNYLGMPSYPVLSPSGAMAVHLRQTFILNLIMFAATVYLAWNIRKVAYWSCLAWAAVVMYPILATHYLTQELMQNYGGVGGELLFAAIFMWRGWTGGFIESQAERPVYTAVAWIMIIDNFNFALGLIFSSSFRAMYSSNGSFGLTNDLIKAASNMGVSLQTAALPLLLATIATPIFVALFSHSYLKWKRSTLS
ncbi:MAG: hypothetical protein HRU15_03100 [Planctomycetes bacterium]|nr:hypothetical protein [Planctomycetota bacterium]